MAKQKNTAAVALGTRGGRQTYKRYGKTHYQKMAAKRWGSVDKSAIAHASGRSIVNT